MTLPTRDDVGPAAPVTGANVLLNDCEAQTVIGLKALFRRMFERADDLLFEMADKGDSADSQEVYVEGMRTVRIKRAQMERAFAEGLRKAFKEYSGRTGPSVSGGRPGGMDDGSLSLIEEDELEESLALGTMGERAADEYNDVLKTLTERFARLNPAKADLELKDMPFSPQVIVEALKSASGLLSVAIRVKVIVYKLFDKLVINQLGELYHDLDERLAKAGVAPEVKVARKPARKRSSGDGEQASSGAASEAEGQQPDEADNAAGSGSESTPPPNREELQSAEQLLQTLHSMLTQHRTVGQPGVPLGGGFGGAIAGPTFGGAGPAVSGNDLVQSLTQLQFDLGQMNAGGAGAGAGAGAGMGMGMGGYAGGGFAGNAPVGFSVGAAGTAVSDVKNLLLRQYTGGGREAAPNVQAIDEDVIDVVGMLFEFILADTNLHPRAKATISRLQIPMVKVALLDKTFFSRKQHPARRLLNTLARSSLGVSQSDDGTDPVMQSVENTVNRILDEFDDDVGLFDQLLHEFQDSIANVEQRTERMESRQVKTMEGQEKLEFSKKQVDGDLAQRITTAPLPKGMRTFFEEKWRHHMLMTCLKSGVDGEDYQNALVLIDKLIWSVEPKQNPKERQQVVDGLRPLLTELRDSLADTFMDPEIHKAPFFKELQAFQLSALRGQDPAADEREEMGINPPEPPKPVDRPAAAVVDPGLPDEVVQEIRAQTQAQGDQADDDYTDNAVSLDVGTWMELESDTGNAVRVKLSWRSPLSARCLFVNSRGLKELEVTTDEIAEFLRDGKLKPLDGAPLVDRGMHALVDGLKGGTEEPAAGG